MVMNPAFHVSLVFAWIVLSRAAAGDADPRRFADDQCGQAMSMPQGLCSFEHVRALIMNDTWASSTTAWKRMPAACRSLVADAAVNPDTFATECLPGVLLALLLRTYDRKDKAACNTSANMALEVEYYYSNIQRLWPREMREHWVGRWPLQQYVQKVDAVYDRTETLVNLERICSQHIRAQSGPAVGTAKTHAVGGTESILMVLQDSPDVQDMRVKLLQKLPAWLDSQEEHSRFDDCYESPPATLVCGMVSRSQLGQDLWVLARFGLLAPPPLGRQGGFFIEIGAHHPEALSNSYLLERLARWQGLCIEPFPRGNWHARNAKLIQAVVGPEDEWLEFFKPGSVWGGLHKEARKNGRLVNAVSEGELIQMVSVRTRSFESVFTQAKQEGIEVPPVVHYVSLDTEGSEYDLLQVFPFDHYVPLSFTIEHHHEEPRRTKIQEFLYARGYELELTVGHDDFFLLKGFEQYLD